MEEAGDRGRGRRRGPISQKSVVFTTRITGDTRRALEERAAQSGRSISQEAELLLVSGLHGADDSLRDLDTILSSVSSTARAIAGTQGGRGLADSAHLYFAVYELLQWAQSALPYPDNDPVFADMAELDRQIAEGRAALLALKGRNLDVRTSEERQADVPANDRDASARRIEALSAERAKVQAAIGEQRRTARLVVHRSVGPTD